MTSQIPHGVWIYLLSALQPDYLALLQRCGVQRVYLKILDGHSPDVFWEHQCTPQIVAMFRSHGIDVWGWGFHYGDDDFSPEISALKDGLDCKISGYVIDMEEGGEDPSRRPAVEALLKEVAETCKDNLAYTSFGDPALHPKFPWTLFDQYCDYAMPQIYYEKFRLGKTDDDTVQACLEAHRKLNLVKPLLPIWSSEPGAKTPASVDSLQKFMRQFPGSSIWRAPGAKEDCNAFRLDYGDDALPAGLSAVNVSPQITPIGPLKRVLRYTSEGPDVALLQTRLKETGFYHSDISGRFDDATRSALKDFQSQAGVAVDGVAGPETWNALGGHLAINYTSPSHTAAMANIAMQECNKGLRWTGPDCEAEKYLAPLRAPMEKLGQIGKDIVFFNWCAAFVTWCARGADIDVPDQPEGCSATMALVDSWAYWAKKTNSWIEGCPTDLARGDILLFKWNPAHVDFDHIGIVASYANGALMTYEGNRGNQTFYGSRNTSTVAGVVRISG